MSAQQQAELPFACSGTLTRLHAVHYANLDLDVTPYFCITDGKATLYHVDASGNQRSLDDLRLADEAAFRDRYHRLARDLRARIARDGESVSQSADIWFPTPLAADQKVPPKAEFLALGAAQQKAIIGAHNAAIAARAHEVAAIVHSVAPGAIVEADSPAFKGQGPLLRVEATPAALRAIGDHDGIQYVGLALRADEDQPASTAWFPAGQFDVMQYLGVDGDGVSVADVLGSAGLFDTRYLAPAGTGSGNCTPPYGSSYDCHCAASAGTPTGAGHMQFVMSIIKNTWGGAQPSGSARHSATLAANGDAACPSSYLDDLVQWAIGQGASVINRSASNPYSWARYLDYVVTAWPWPSVVASAGNYNASIGQSPNIQTHLDNGLVVGATDDHGSSNRATMTMANFSCWQNIDNEELPEIVAPGVNIDGVSDSGSTPVINHNLQGTSFAAPQVSGAIASLQELQSAPFKTWPEAVFPIMMVSAFTDTDPAGPDNNLFNLDDGVDDKDGAGLLAAGEAWEVAFAGRQLPGNAASDRGFDYGSASPSSWPAGTESGYHYASVAPGDWLRVATVMLNHPSCGSPVTYDNCTANVFPLYYLYVYNSTTGDVFSINEGNNYKYLVIQNQTASTQTFRIVMYMDWWNLMTGDTWGLAWDSRVL